MAEFDPWLALYSLWHRGEARGQRLVPADQLPREFQPLSPDDAVQRLLADRSLRARQLRTFAVAELARGFGSPELPELNHAVQLIERLMGSNGRMPMDNAWTTLLEKRDDERADRMLEALRLTQPRDRRLPLRSMSTMAKYCCNSMVSTITVTAIIDKPIESLIGPSDPRSWGSLFPEMWPRSDTVNRLPDFYDRDTDPERVCCAEEYDSRFFEKVYTTAPGIGLKLGTIRNILNVTRSVSDPQNTGFTYKLVECLSTDIDFGRVQPGGIDRDSGYARFTPDLAGDSVTLEVQKSIRFTQPQAFVNFTNQMACINTMLLLEMLVMAAAS